ncbi:hypothetical protein BT69DRAFT_1352196 [Atractiella rhizophila]|nr:hypothetical protein BT69DRAFT_1352196 [Atractiella rhizophila]
MTIPPIQVTQHHDGSQEELHSSMEESRAESQGSTAVESSLTMSPVILQPTVSSEEPSGSIPQSTGMTSADANDYPPPPRPKAPLSLNTTALAAVEALASPKSPNLRTPLSGPQLLSPPSASKLKFQEAIRKTINIQTAASHGYVWTNQQEPGIDVRKADYSHLKEELVIDVADYDRDRIRQFNFNNAEFLSYLEKDRPKWAKVRWINVNGLSWDVLRAIALKYDLHPLAIEDTMHTGSSTRPKAEFYENHLFLNLMLHSLLNDDQLPPELGSRRGSLISGFFGGRSQRPLDEEKTLAGAVDPEVQMSPLKRVNTEGLGHGIGVGTGGTGGRTSRTSKVKEMFQGAHPDDPTASVNRTKSDIARRTVNSLTKDYKVHVGSAQLNIFLMRDGTLISFFQRGAAGYVTGLFNRLRESQTLLRITEDPSMLVHNLLDLVSDHALEIVEEFRKRITFLEGQVLVKPMASTVRHLHVLSAELLLLKRTLSPLASVVRRVRDHQVLDAVALPGRSHHHHNSHRRYTDNSMYDSRHDSFSGEIKKEPFISRTAEIYLADVADHVDSVLSSIELFTALASNLVDFTFNMISYNSNTSMMTLTVVTVVFLPLTFWAGYFGKFLCLLRLSPSQLLIRLR